MCYFCVKIRSWDKCVDPGAKWCLNRFLDPRRFCLNFSGPFWKLQQKPIPKKASTFYGSFVVQANHWGSCEKTDPTKPQHCLKNSRWGALPWVLALGVSPSSNFFSSRNVVVEKKRWKKSANGGNTMEVWGFKVDGKIKLTALQFAPFWGRNLIFRISGVIIWPYPTCLLRFTCQR